MKQLKDQALRFLRLADKDIKAFEVLKINKEVDLSIVCFHAQQAVEKLLKAVLIFHAIDPTRTHDLMKLSYSALEIKLELPITIEELSKLNPYAVIFRYDDMEIEILSRNEADEIVRTMRNWARQLLTN